MTTNPIKHNPRRRENLTETRAVHPVWTRQADARRRLRRDRIHLKHNPL